MNEKQLFSRIQLKGDSYAEWIAKDPVLLKNEIAIVTIVEEDNALVNKPGTYFKVGDGVKKFSELGFTSGIAGDVYQWAKAAEKPVYTATEIQGIDDYISGQIKDTNTRYQIIQDTENPRKFTLQSKEVDGEWTDVTVVTIPESEHTLIEGTTNGTVNYNNVDVPVHGLKSAAYQEVGAFEVAGAAATVKTEIIGTDADASSADTIKGVKKYVTEQINSIPEVTVSEYTIAKKEVPVEGYAASYELQKDGAVVGDTINIPKDYLVKSATIKTAVEENDPSGLPAGTKYIDFVVNTTEGSGNETHIYLNIAELVDVYTGTGVIEVSLDNKISIKVDESTGLSTAEGKLGLALATETTPGGMSADDKKKLDGLHAIATSGNVNDLVQTEGDILVLNCGNATL